ncbi:hypothetical protein EPUL_004433, partial [Erysiphe pulchra]
MSDSMEISQETQAPSTETSNQPSPIPPKPPIPNSPSPFATPPTPSDSQLPNKNIVARHILKPTAPSKRPASIQIPQNITENTGVENLFLPKELAEIIATRQRRERAWHARVLICTTVISYIDSTLAAFEDEIEKEEAAAFKTYLELAIANFAAADSSPTPPKIPSHTRPMKTSGHGSGKDKDVMKKGATEVQRDILSGASNGGNIQGAQKLPKIPQMSDKTWATVARLGQKKARVTLSSKTPVATANGTINHRAEKEKSMTTSPDKRLFVRLPQDHEWRKLSPAGIREILVQKLSISPTLIGKIKPVSSGFALSPSSNEAREQILKAENGLFLSGAKLEPATNWVPVIIPTVPSFICKLQGKIEVSKEMLADEIERVCSIRPALLKLYGRNNPEAPHRTWMALFSKAPRPGFRVFDESGIGRPFKKQQTLEFCKRCNGHHATKNCSRAPSCGNCGSTNHVEDNCMAATKCRNCGGPHRSESRRCLARPTRLGAPSKEQMKIYRQAGEREYQAI